MAFAPDCVSAYVTLSWCSGEIASALQQEISYLANAYGGPTFPPHVTLVGGINGSDEHALQLATELATKLKV